MQRTQTIVELDHSPQVESQVTPVSQTASGFRNDSSLAVESTITSFIAKESIMKQTILAGSASILMATAAYAAYNITHPNLKDADGAIQQAIHHIQEAQQANKGTGGFGGHEDAAIGHLRQAQSELIEGDKYNDAHKKPK